MTGCANDCSKPKKVWPRMLSTVIAIAKRRKPPKRFDRLFISFALIADPLLTTEHDGVPAARRQLNRFALQPSARVAPTQLDGYEFISGEMAQPELQIRTALARMPVTTVNLLHERCASR